MRLKSIYEKITQQELLEFLGNFILYKTPKRRKISIHAVSYAIADIGGEKHRACGTHVENLGDWRAAFPMQAKEET